MISFDLHAVGSVAEAIDLLGRYGEDAQLLAGGTSLMVLGRLGLLAAEHVVDLHGVGGLAGVVAAPSGELRIGAMTRLRVLETDPRVRATLPALSEALHAVATVRIRNQATIGGNLAHADPAQDPPPMLMALGAWVEITGTDGTRSLAVDDLFAGYLTTTLEPWEVLTAVIVPPLPTNVRAAYLKFLPGSQDDYATVSVAVAVSVRDGRCEWARVALGGAAGTPVRALSVETALRGQPLEQATIEAAAQLVGTDIDPVADRRGSTRYKRTVAAVCVRRALSRATVGVDGV